MEWKLVLTSCLLMASTFMVEQASSANILVISFFSSKSHKITYLPLIEELGKRGHNITMVTPIKPMKEMKNVKEITTFDAMALFQNDKLNMFDLKEKGEQMNFFKIMEPVYESCETSYDLPQVKALLKENFDLIFMQPMFNDCILGLVYRLKAPMVLFTPTASPAVVVEKVGGYFPPSITPTFALGYPANMTFAQRFVNYGVYAVFTAFFKFFYQPRVEKIYRDKLGSDIPSIDEILADQTSLVLSNGHFSLTEPKPYMPDMVDVGGIHSRPAKPLPKDLEDFINKGKDGFIVFSMGSAIKGDMMPEAKRKMILNDIRLFITHCGGGSTEESIYHGVPLVGIPMMADQPTNAKLAKKHGFLVELDWNDLKEEDFMNAIQEILNNPKYRENAKKLSTLFRDRPIDPLDLGVYWVEYVLRHKGAPHLRSKPARTLNVFQYHSFDVIGAYLAILLIILTIIIKTVKFIVRKTCCRSKKQVLSKGKKTN